MNYNQLNQSQRNVPINMLLCNLPNCRMGRTGGKAPALRLCPCCRSVGYCCEKCMQDDWQRHLTRECQKVCENCDKCVRE